MTQATLLNKPEHIIFVKMELAENIYESYGTHLRDLKVVGHPILINNFEDFIENMR